jgi:hypothetical protein
MPVCRVLLLCLLLVSPLGDSQGASAQIKKVLPHYLDKEGRHTLAPSLYERDAYQARLRQNPSERSALRFAVNWKAARVNRSNLKLRLELRTSKGDLGKPVVIDSAVKAPILFSKWSSLTLQGETYEGIGEIIGWRVSLWDGELRLAEEKSFLW